MMSSSKYPVHYALDELGVKEIKGAEHNPRILEYHDTTTLGDWGRSRDETPWCSSFINWAHVQAGIEGTDNALARSWATWGVPCEPTMGCVAVLKRRRKGSDARTGSRGGYHVVFYLAESRGRIQALSGNTSDKVGIDYFARSKWDVVAFRTEDRT